MNLQRWVFLLASALLATLTYAVETNALPKWTMLIGLGCVFLTHLIQATTQAIQIPKADPASKVSTSVRPPPVTLLCLLLLAGCGAEQAVAAEGTYTSSQLACVDRYNTRGEIDTCRAAVRQAWGRGPDAGADVGTDGAK